MAVIMALLSVMLSAPSQAANFPRKLGHKIISSTKSGHKVDKVPTTDENNTPMSILILGSAQETKEFLKSALSEEFSKETWRFARLAYSEFHGPEYNCGSSRNYSFNQVDGAVMMVDIHDENPRVNAHLWQNEHIRYFPDAPAVLVATGCDEKLLMMRRFILITSVHDKNSQRSLNKLSSSKNAQRSLKKISNRRSDRCYLSVLPKELMHVIKYFFMCLYVKSDIFNNLKDLESYATEMKVPFIETSSKYNFQTAHVISLLYSDMKNSNQNSRFDY